MKAKLQSMMGAISVGCFQTKNPSLDKRVHIRCSRTNSLHLDSSSKERVVKPIDEHSDYWFELVSRPPRDQMMSQGFTAI
jgi:hypothetical protein